MRVMQLAIAEEIKNNSQTISEKTGINITK